MARTAPMGGSHLARTDPLPRLAVNVLGPLIVRTGDGPVSLAGRRVRALLCRLLAEPAAVVPAATLVHDVWEGRPTPGAPATLQSHVARLRRALGWHRIRTSEMGYALDMSGVEYDVWLFERELEAAQRSLARGAAPTAASAAGAALARWRGAAFADVEGASWVQAETARLSELHARAEELEISALLAGGDAAAAVARTEAAIVAHRYREALWASLLVGLYRLGRQTEALRAYQRARQMLREELGLEPWPGLARLERAILEHAPELETAESLQETLPVPHSGPALPASLRRQLGSRLVGREDHVARIVSTVAGAALTGVRVVLVSGPQGSGKTRLLAEVVQRVLASGGCAGYGRARASDDEPGAALRLALRSLQPDGALPVRSLAAMLEHLARLAVRSPVLLALDELEHMDRHAADVLCDLVTDAPDVPLVVLGSFREEELPDAPVLTAVLGRLGTHGDVKRLRLAGLDRPAVSELVVAQAGLHATAEGVDAVLSATGGNPFLVNCLVDHLVTTGGARRTPQGSLVFDHEAVAAATPPALAGIVEHRLGQLDTAVRRLVTTAAVLPAPVVRCEVLADVLREDYDVVLDLCHAASLRGWLRPSAQPESCEFVYPLVRNAVRAASPWSVRARVEHVRRHRAALSVVPLDEGGPSRPARPSAAFPRLP